MSTYTFDHIQLDPGDPGIQWIEGVGFRPVDMTEEYAGGMKFCGQIIGENECVSEDGCSFGKWAMSEKWEPPLDWPWPPLLYPPVYNTPPIYTPLTSFPVPIWWPGGGGSSTPGDTPTVLIPFDDPDPDPPTGCCVTPTGIPTGDPPPAVPLPPSALLLIGALFLLKRILN